jgi:hypothetical protein
MYTVVRFTGEIADDPNLYRLGEQLNLQRLGAFTKLGRTKTSFSCSVAVSGDWEAHSKAIIEVIEQCRALMRRAAKLGIKVSFDTALEPQDLRGVNLLSLPVEETLMNALSKVGAVIEFSCYLMAKDAAKSAKKIARKRRAK